MSSEDFQNSARISVRLAQRSAGSPTKSEAETDKAEETDNPGTGTGTGAGSNNARGKAKARGRGGGARARSASRASLPPDEHDQDPDAERGEKIQRRGGSRGRGARGRARRGSGSSEAPRSPIKTRASRTRDEGRVESDEEQSRPSARASHPPSESEADSGPRRRGGRGRPVSESRRGGGVSSGSRSRPPVSNSSSVSLGGNYESVLESVVSAHSALGPRLRQRAVEARATTGSPSLGGSVGSPVLGAGVGSPVLGGVASISLSGTRSDAGTIVSETTGAGLDVEMVGVGAADDAVSLGREVGSPSRREAGMSSWKGDKSPVREDRQLPVRADRNSPIRKDFKSTSGKDWLSVATPIRLLDPDRSLSPQEVFLVIPDVGLIPLAKAEERERKAGTSRRRFRGDQERDRESPAKRSRVDKGKGKAIPDDNDMDCETAGASVVDRRQSRRRSKPTARAIESAQQEREEDNRHGYVVDAGEGRSTGSSVVSESSMDTRPSASKSSRKSSKRKKEESEEPSNHLKRQRASTEVESIRSKSTPSKTPVVQLRRGDFVLRLQDKRCFHYNWDQAIVPRCLACRKKQAGDTCRFVGIRYFKLTPDSPDAIGVSFDSRQKSDEPEYHLPPTWNVVPEIAQVQRLRSVIARALYPILEKELEHALKANSIWRPVEIEVRATCDVCATSMFASCHMCTQCGRELCGGCYQQVEDMCPAGTPSYYGHTKRKDYQLHKYRACAGNSIFHLPSSFRPITRFVHRELAEILKDMSDTIQGGLPASEPARPGSSRIAKWASRVFPGRPFSPQASTEPPALSEAGSSHDVSSLRGTPDPQLAPMPIIASPTMSPSHEETFSPEVGVEAGKRPPAPQSAYVDPAGIPSHPIDYFSADITEEVFKPIWAKGHALVVQGLLDSFKIKWTPKYFIEEYGEQECFVVDCKTDTSSISTVEEFFLQFGNPDRGDQILKLKDWPAMADFRDDFPDLFQDFMDALPIPNYTRRDGILNVASHFATNAIAPDLGPKMYNAFASDEGPGGQGSTRLHMDMADAVNIMMYANDCKDGRPGTAAWDIFQASDSDKIRAYLRRHFDNKTIQYRDPIHSQLFYLDSDHRRRLYEEEGVYSWRIYQRPGDAVFIPAGCAHQVCNLADCIKVAIDFVSLENIDRCEKLTAEFRNENDTFTWKEDVLQLRTMMMYAWYSATQLHKAWVDRTETAEA